MDAGQQPPLAPLELRHVRGEPAAQHEPLVLERAEREVDVRDRNAEGAGQLRRRGGADHFELSPHQLAQRVLAGPHPGAFAVGCC